MTVLENAVTGTVFYVPADLSECDTKQYIDVCDLIYQFNKGVLDYTAFANQAIYKLLNLVPAKKSKLTPEQDLEKNANISLLSGLMDGFFEQSPEGEVLPTIKQDYVHNHITTVKPLWCRYYGPTDQFRNISFGEYSDSINLLIEFEKTKDDQFLRLLMAMLYRKKRKFHKFRNLFDYKADVREAYNVDTIEARATVFKNARMGELYGFYLFLASFHKYLTTCKIPFNGALIDIGVLFRDSDTKQVTSDMPGLGLKSIEYQLSETGVFGNNKEVRNTNLWEILIRLYDITKRDKDDLARQKAAEAAAKTK